jgi:DNA-binding Xre family transcriptional regulator
MANLLKIKDLARMRNISLKQLAEDVGISEQALHQLIRRNTTAIATLETIATKLNVSPVVFFDDGKAALTVNQSVTGAGNTQVSGNGNHIDVTREAITALARQLDVKDGQIDRLIGIIADAGRREG